MLGRAGKHRRIIQRPEHVQYCRDTQNKPEVTDAVDEKGLEARKIRGFPLKPESNQEIRQQSDRLPAKKQLQEIVGHNQHQHGKGEERDITEEPRVTRVVVHVSNGVHVHHQGNKSHDDHHHRAQFIN